MNQNQTCPMGLGFKLKEIYVMYKNLKTPAVQCLENGNYHMYRKLFHAKQLFEIGPSARKLQEPGNKQNQIKLTTLAIVGRPKLISVTC